MAIEEARREPLEPNELVGVGEPGIEKAVRLGFTTVPHCIGRK